MNDNFILKITLLILSLFLFNGAIAQQHKSGNNNADSLYFISPVLLNCKIQLPENFNKDTAYSMLICLHGGGSTFETFSEFCQKFKNPYFINAIPEAPYKWLLDGNIGYDWAGWPSGDLAFMQESIGLTSTYISNLVSSLRKNYNTDKFYLLGFSQGSIITQVAGIRNHELLAGLIILSGPEPFYPDKPEIVWPDVSTIKNASELKIFIAHGKTDPLVDHETAVNSKSFYESYGFEVTFFEFEGGHEIPDQVIENINNWLSEQ